MLNDNVEEFLGLGPIRRRLIAVEKKTSTRKTPPSVTGSTDSQKITSLIEVFTDLGLIKNATT